ncbi:MAG: hypothetical protein NC078_09490 [Ruminococcus sp.]|nr:hypothetical protein [Ruminococcus sp.]
MKMHFEEESRLVPDSRCLPGTAMAAAIGRACAVSVPAGERIFIAHSGEKGANALARAFGAGCAEAGQDAVFGGECSAWAAANAVKVLGCAMGCHVHTEITPLFRLFAADGLCLDAAAEDRITAQILSPKQKELPYSHYGVISEFSGTRELYVSSLRKRPGGSVKGVYADVYSSSAAVTEEALRALKGKNDPGGERIAFHIGADGGRLSAYSDSTGYVFREKLLMLCCRELFERGEDAAFCGRPPRWLEKMAAGYGRKVISCGRSVCSGCGKPSEECRQARRLASSQSFTEDGIALMLETLEVLRRRGESLKDAIASLPAAAVISRYIPADRPSELLRRLCGTGHTEGVLSDSERGLVTVRPVRTGKGLMLGVESFAIETAAELCDFYSEVIIKEREKQLDLTKEDQ